MNWLAKINLNSVVQNIGVFRSSLLLVLLIFVCLFCGYRMGNYFHNYQSDALSHQKKRLELLYNIQTEQIKRINTLEVELEVERMASQRSLTSLKEVESAHYQLKKELAFYEKVMAPEKQIEGVVLDELAITPTEKPNEFNFKAVLMQQQKQKRYSKGNIDIVVFGKLAGADVKFTLKDLSTMTSKELSFSFKFFQTIVGTLTIPEKFVPEKVNIVITQPKSRWQKYRRLEESFQWQEKLNNTENAIPVILD